MDNDGLKRITRVVFIVILIINLIIAFYCFQSIRYTSEFAGWLINLGTKIKIIFIGVVFSFISSLVVRLICKYVNNETNVFLFSIVLAGTINIGYYNINISIINPKPLTEKQLIKSAIKSAKENKKEATKLLKKAELFVPNEKIIESDKNTLGQGIKNLLLSFNEQSKFYPEMSDSLKLSHINELLSMNYRKADTISFQMIADSLQCDFILYSLNYQHFIAVSTYYRYYEDRISNYNGLVLFCERKEDAIDVYSYTHPVSQSRGYTREEFLYMAILHMGHMGHYSLSSKYLKTDDFLEYPHPLKKDFWHDKYFFSVVTIEDKNYLRYQTTLDRGYNRSKGKYEYVVRPMYKIRFDR
jgi:hypothetical protein